MTALGGGTAVAARGSGRILVDMATVPTRYWHALADGRVQCDVCPRECKLHEGQAGLCFVRSREDDQIVLTTYGRSSGFCVDPIEKKPLYHFHPGAPILSVGFVGCSFSCGFCQNHTISQRVDAPTDFVSPEDLVSAAVRQRSFGIAYTYSEPLIHFEYVLDCARLARTAGLANVLVTNGFLNPEPAEELLPLVDAANIDLKAWDPEFYRTEVGGKLEEVKRFIAQAAPKIHVEVTTLVIPGKNDTAEQIEGIAGFVASVDPGIPLHLSCYYPMYKYTIPATPPETVYRLADVARRHLKFVYVGNVGADSSDTACPGCGAVLVHRVGYRVRVDGIRDGACTKCGAKVPIVGV